MTAEQPMTALVANEIAKWTWTFVDGQYDACIAWLQRIGCRVTYQRAGDFPEYHLDGVTGIRCGLSAADDPVAIAAQLGLLVLGTFSSAAIGAVVKEWDARGRANRAKGRPS